MSPLLVTAPANVGVGFVGELKGAAVARQRPQPSKAAAGEDDGPGVRRDCGTVAEPERAGACDPGAAGERSAAELRDRPIQLQRANDDFHGAGIVEQQTPPPRAIATEPGHVESDEALVLEEISCAAVQRAEAGSGKLINAAREVVDARIVRQRQRGAAVLDRRGVVQRQRIRDRHAVGDVDKSRVGELAAHRRASAEKEHVLGEVEHRARCASRSCVAVRSCTSPPPPPVSVPVTVSDVPVNETVEPGRTSKNAPSSVPLVLSWRIPARTSNSPPALLSSGRLPTACHCH